MKQSRNQVVIGAIVTEAMGIPSVFRNPMCAFAFAETVFEHNQPVDLDITITLEQAERMSSVSGRLEIAGGTLEMMEASIAAIRKEKANERSAEENGQPAKERGSFIQLCIGSKEFCQAFVRFWAASIGPRSVAWETQLLTEFSSAKPTDVIWIDVLSPGRISRDNASKMMMRNIGCMVM